MGLILYFLMSVRFVAIVGIPPTHPVKCLLLETIVSLDIHHPVRLSLFLNDIGKPFSLLGCVVIECLILELMQIVQQLTARFDHVRTRSPGTDRAEVRDQLFGHHNPVGRAF